jgi:hypothetical protein
MFALTTECFKKGTVNIKTQEGDRLNSMKVTARPKKSKLSNYMKGKRSNYMKGNGQ